MSDSNRPDEKRSYSRRTALKLTGGIALGSASAGTAAAGGGKHEHKDYHKEKKSSHKHKRSSSSSSRRVRGRITFENKCKTVCVETKPDTWWTLEVEFTNGDTTTVTNDEDACYSFYKSERKKKTLRIASATLYKGEDSTEGRELDSAECEYDDDGHGHRKSKKDDDDDKKKKHWKDDDDKKKGWGGKDKPPGWDEGKKKGWKK